MIIELKDYGKLQLEDYVACVVASEIGNAPLEACKAQAVAARTNAVVYALKEKPVPMMVQAFFEKRLGCANYPVAKQGTYETAGQILCYGGQPCSPCSFSYSNGGIIVSSQERWGSARAWLVSKTDPWNGEAKNGHGVGMSQLGAINMAKSGFLYNDILEWYYPNADLSLMLELPTHVLNKLAITVR